MKFFLDTANLSEIKEAVETGLIDGVTTNPSLVAKEGRSFHEVVKEICGIVKGPTSAEVISTDFSGMMKEAEALVKISEHVVIKVPLTVDGLRTCKALSLKGVAVNVTLCFSTNQALLAAKAGASYISPFIGRLDDIGEKGVELVEDIVALYVTQGFQTEVLAASIRHPDHIRQVAMAGAQVATMPYKVFKQLYQHPLTESGLKQFLADWASVQ